MRIMIPNHRESFHNSPSNAVRLFLGGLALCYRNDFCGTRHRVDWMLTARFSVSLAVVDL